MDVQSNSQHTGVFSRRFWRREFFASSETRGSAVLYSALTFFAAWLLSRTHAVFGTYPFALAYLAAANRRLPFVLAGACLGALSLGERGYIYCLSYAGLILLRLLLSRPREEGRFLPACREYFEELAPLRLTAATLSGFFLAVYQLIAGGLSISSVAFALSSVFLPPLLAAVYVGFFDDGRTLYAVLSDGGEGQARARDWYFSLSLGALCASLLLGAGGASLFGISLSLVLACFGAVFFSQKWGILRGVAVALVLSLGTLSLSYIPALAAMALAVALLHKIGLFYALFAACVGGTAVAFLIEGQAALIGFLPEATVSVALAWPLYKHLPAFVALVGEERRHTRAEAARAAERRGRSMRRMEMFSQAYASLAEVFSRMADAAARPSEGEYKEAARAVFSRYCQGCAGYGGCWERGERNAARASECLGEQYARGIPPPEVRLPESMMRSCGFYPRISSDIREACAALEENKRAKERAGVFARNYRMTADMLAEAARRELSECEEDYSLGRAAGRVFSEMGTPARQVSVFGGRRRFVVASGVRWDATRASEDELRGRLEEVCHCRLAPPTYESAAGGGMRVRLESERRFSVTCHQAGAARGREISGDAFSTFEGEGDYFYALLSDGMGSGREAAVTAGLCGAFLRQTLAAGATKGTALRALNGVLCERGTECSATVDLLELDLLYGRACFVKSGAAASYILRGDSLFRIRSGTVPIGILEALDAEKIRFDVSDGDLIVMLSDGISQSTEDAAWLCELLTAAPRPDLETLAERILDGARTHADRTDDMTVALLEVHEEKRGAEAAA